MKWLRLLGCGGLGCGSGFAGVGTGDLAAEALDAAGGVDQLLLAGEEGVAGGADFDHQVSLVRGAGIEGVAAGALDVDGFVLRVNSFFGHGSLSLMSDVACRLAVRLQREGAPSHRSACRGSPQSPGLFQGHDG